VEFAIVLPALMMILLGLLTGGITLNRKIAVTNGVREGSRYGATLPISAAPSCGDTPINCWLKSVATVTQQGSEGELNSSVSSMSICVAYVHPGASGSAQVTQRLVRTRTGDVISAATCYADGRPSDQEKRVQVTGSRLGRLEFIVLTLNPTLSSRSVARFEAG
jgi:hypothetical protein